MQKFFGYANRLLQLLSGRLVSEDLGGEDAGCGGPRLVWLHVVVRPVGCTAKFSETPLEMSYGREINIQFTGNSSGGHFCNQHANCMLPSLLMLTMIRNSLSSRAYCFPKQIASHIGNRGH